MPPASASAGDTPAAAAQDDSATKPKFSRSAMASLREQLGRGDTEEMIAQIAGTSPAAVAAAAKEEAARRKVDQEALQAQLGGQVNPADAAAQIAGTISEIPDPSAFPPPAAPAASGAAEAPTAPGAAETSGAAETPAAAGAAPTSEAAAASGAAVAGAAVAPSAAPAGAAAAPAPPRPRISRIEKMKPQPRRAPPKGVQRAAHHLRFKRVMWMPATVIALVCLVVGVYCFLPKSPPNLPTLPDWNKQIVYSKDGHAWGIPQGAQYAQHDKDYSIWYDAEGGIEEKAVDATIYVKAKESHDNIVAKFESDKLIFLGFGAAFVLVALTLAFFVLWMRHDIKMVERANLPVAEELAPPPGQGPVAAPADEPAGASVAEGEKPQTPAAPEAKSEGEEPTKPA
jgi:hypothetical protein